ncbi:SMP-30/gluconolactonase/LRE family protein [Cupriavidus sp. D384]|uniref:SMP-30/gluconolactonase/LRE family protein n=1 Tax=Cupriavidus sp. D384 TaxID=1538095 RepID=UPI0009ECF069|nr:SMP-30/gluconolactonase/LRE family protein [Cupriavidus sp. D384]
MFFSAPPRIEATVFAELPQHLRPAKPNAEWCTGQPAGTPSETLLEGPSFDRDGNLYCVDLPNGRIFRIAGDGSFELLTEYDGWPNGLKVHRDGRLFVADFKRGLLTVDPQTGKVSSFLERAGLEHFKAINDLFFATNGDLYFTDQGLTGLHDATGRLFRVTRDGKVSCLLSNIPSPNGVVMDLEERSVFVAATRANAVWRVPLDKDGNATKVGIFVQLSGGNGPDGLALDAQGGLAIAHVGLGSVWLVDRFGEPTARIQADGHRHTTNVAFGGHDGKTLFITESGSGTILQASVEIGGNRMFSHQ